MIHWFVQEGGVRDLLSAAVFLLLGRLATWRPWKRHREDQQRIVDALDTSTPGGITDVLEAVHDAAEKPETRSRGATAHTRPQGGKPRA